MRTITQNYWGKNTTHIIPRWLDKDIKVINPKPIQMKLKRELHDTDSDGVPNFADCNPWNPNEQGWLHDQGAKVYNRIKEATLLRKQRVLAENEKDRRLTVYHPSGEKDTVDEENHKKYGRKIYSGIKKGAKFAKDVYEETKQFNPETRKTPGTFFVWFLVTIRDQAGNVVHQSWRDTGKRYTSKEEAIPDLEELRRRGITDDQIKLSESPVPKQSHVKENVQEGLRIKKKQGTPMAQVMIHAGRGMSGQQVQQQAGYSSRSTAGYSPPFVGATKKQFRVGGDR